MRKSCIHLMSIALLGLALAGVASAPAMAGGWGHGHFHGGHHHWHSSFSLGFVVPLYPYPRDYYYPPPPRVVYVDRPPVCRRFDGDATVDANGRRFFGTACLWADGRWHIVN